MSLENLSKRRRFFAAFALSALLFLGTLHWIPNTTAQGQQTRYVLNISGMLDKSCQISYRVDDPDELVADLKVEATSAREAGHCIVTVEAELGLPGLLTGFNVEGDGEIGRLQVNAHSGDDVLAREATVELTIKMLDGAFFIPFRLLSDELSRIP